MSKTTIFIFILSIFSFSIQADPGDTIVVQTFEYDGFPVGPGWLSPREGHFDFSSVDGLNFEKVLLQYNLKCDNTQSPACGEWDYLSYIKVMEHTGKGEFPNFLIGGQGGYKPNEIFFMNNTSWNYKSREEKSIVFEDSTSDDYQIGEGNIPITNIFDVSLNDARNMFIFRASELIDAGFTAGIITGMKFEVTFAGEPMRRLTMRMKQTSSDVLSESPDLDGFTTVYSKDTEFTGAGWQNFDFTTFFEWDGTSNIVLDLFFDDFNGEVITEIIGSDMGWNCTASSSESDNFFNFNGPDIISLPTDNFSSLNQEVTVSFWLKGNGEQPQDDSVFEGRDADGNRVLNVHLPWSNGHIYWDAGDDRIEKNVSTPNQYKGKWNHYAFTKNAETGEMKIYINGELWHSGTDKTNSFTQIDTFVIGRGLWNANNFYDGKIDEFRVWSQELSEETINEWMKKSITSDHPDFDNLLAYYKFDEDSGYTTLDEVSLQNAVLRGVPQRMNYRGERFKNFSTSTIRPNVKFKRNEFSYNITSEFVVDSFPKGEMLIEKYIQTSPGEKPVLDEVVHAYPTYYNNFVFNENGIATDSTEVVADETINFEWIEYNTDVEGEEILNPWEIGRFITPYGNGLSLGDDGWTWVFDVTDFQHLLHGNDVHMKAGNFQELLNLKVLFIEGTPPRDLIKIENLYSVNPQLSSFDNVVVNKTVELLPEAKMFTLKSTVSGHWFGVGNNCGEFCSNIHTVDVNDVPIDGWDIIQECGENPLFPQGGTWFYDRAGWCPGMEVTQRNTELTPYINVGVDDEVTVDYDIQYDPYGNYVTEIFFVSYDEPNFQNEASLEEIIAPNKNKANNKFNPICGSPIIKIKNTGSADLTSVTLEYGVEGQEVYSYTWTGGLEFLEEEIIELPPMNSDDFYNSSNNRFKVNILSSNEIPDEYPHNNEIISNFELAPVYDQQQIIWFRTNKKAGETRYSIYNSEGEQVFARYGASANTTYKDTLDLAPGCYKFVAYDSAGDGMYDWPASSGNGYIKFKNLDNTLNIELEKWFGETITHNFVNTASSTETNNIETPIFAVYPNPSDGVFNIEFLENNNDYRIIVNDITGKEVFSDKLNSQHNEVYKLDLSKLSNGFYLLSVKSDDITRVQKIVIEK